VHAAASGVGSAAVAIALDAGARVIATARLSDKAVWVTGLGADCVLDTSVLDSDRLVEQIAVLTDGRGPDVVLDTVGGQTFADSLRAVAMPVASWPWPTWRWRRA
jgi:NADPH2:quinone reductase